MTEPEIIVERKKYGSSAMDYTMRVYQKLDEETIMIDGVKYQKVEEPKPQTLYDVLQDDFDSDDREIVCDVVQRWLGDNIEVDTEEYNMGWNACLEHLRYKIK